MVRQVRNKRSAEGRGAMYASAKVVITRLHVRSRQDAHCQGDCDGMRREFSERQRA